MAKLQFITIEKLLEMRENNEPHHLVEALSEQSFQEVGHIPGAVNIPTRPDMTAEQMAEAAEQKGIGKSDVVVTYCASYRCVASTRAARLLLEAGFENVMDFKAGKQGWKEANFELEQ